MHFDVPALGSQAGDRKARRAAKARALARGATQRALAWLPNPSGKPGKGLATALQGACGMHNAARPAPCLQAFARLSRVRQSA